MFAFLLVGLRTLCSATLVGARWPCVVLTTGLMCQCAFAADVQRFTNAISHVRLLQDPHTLQVTACGPARAQWHSPSGRFRDFRTVSDPVEESTEAVDREGRCFEYRFALAAAADSRRSRDVVRVGGDFLASADAWLFVPPAGSVHNVAFELPPTMRVSTPWAPQDATLTRYRVGAASEGSQPLIAFGTFTRRIERVHDTELDIGMLDGTPPLDVDETVAWVTAAASHVTLTYGVFPVPRVQVLIVPVLDKWPQRNSSGRLEAVPFARVMRDGGFTAQFFVNQTAPLAEYLADWTATHEFSHLLLPYVRRSDAWISEGFASYYQNVLMARAGVIDERRAWQKLLEGFARGRRERYADTLTESIRRRGPNMLMRMYWSGAAVALEADVELRRSGGGNSLDALLAQVHDCCLDAERVWSGRALFQRFDGLTARSMFVSLYESTAHSTRFPDVDSLLADLGVRWREGSVELDQTAPLAGIRRAIMAPPLSTRLPPIRLPVQGRAPGSDRDPRP